MSEETRRVALVTGSSRGIGAAIVCAFAAEGCNVVINHASASSAEAAQALAEEVAREHGIRAWVMPADVSNFDEAAQLISRVKEECGRLDVCVNNAGITRDGLLARMKEVDFDRVIEVNLKGAFNCMRHAAPVMMKQRFGSIVNVSSVVGLQGNAGQVNYAASKAGIVGMTKSAAKELAGRNIRVNAVAPGFIQTDMTAALSERVVEGARGRIALGAFGQPEDVAAAVAFLAGPQAKYITGQVLSVDGGMA